jgi:Bacterial Ig domain/Cadherin-like domain/PKD domain
VPSIHSFIRSIAAALTSPTGFTRCLALLGLLLIASAELLPAQQPDCDPKAAPPTPSFDAACTACPNTWRFTITAPVTGVSRIVWDYGDGGVQVVADGSLAAVFHTYAAPGYYLVTMAVTTTNGLIVLATSGVTVSGSPDLAFDDAFGADMNGTIVIGIQELLSNDVPGVAFVGISPPSKCPLSADGASCTYTGVTLPTGQNVGSDAFSYTVRDASGRTDTAAVDITVTRPLVARPDAFTTGIGTAIDITAAQLLANDSPNAIVLGGENPVNGTLQVIATTAQGPTFRFSPSPCVTGVATFEYLISWDGNPPTERGLVTITMTDNPPIASFTARCGQNGNPPRTCTANPSVGDDMVACNQVPRVFWNWGDGTPTYEVTTPYSWYPQTHAYARSGRYTITLTLIDSAGQTGTTGVYQVEVVPNTRPVAANDSAITDRDVAVRIPVLANDSDPDGDPLSVASVDLSQYPGANTLGSTCPPGNELCIVPPDSFVGTMTFPYTIADPLGLTASATVTLVVNQWTQITDALGEQFYMPQNGFPLRLSYALLLSNDYDDTQPPQQLSIVSFDTSILMGTLDCTSEPNMCTYRPPINAAGVTLFRYTVSDPDGHRDTATVRIYVGFVGTQPTPADDYFTTTRNTSKSFTIQQVVQNDVDPDGDTLTVALASGARDFGNLGCTTPMYSCTYTPNAGFVGTDRFQYTVTDVVNPGLLAYVNVLTLPPTTPTFDAREDMRVTAMNQQLFISYAGLTANDYDPEGDPISVVSVDTTGLLGSLTNCDASGCVYKPPINGQIVTKFKYTASDGHGSSDVAIVKIRVGGTNAAPVAVADSFSTPKNTVLRFSTFELLKNDHDPDNDPPTPIVSPGTTAKGTMACDAKNYWCTYTPKPNVTGADAFTYSLSDSAGGAVSQTLTINILP